MSAEKSGMGWRWIFAPVLDQNYGSVANTCHHSSLDFRSLGFYQTAWYHKMGWPPYGSNQHFANGFASDMGFDMNGPHILGITKKPREEAPVNQLTLGNFSICSTTIFFRYPQKHMSTYTCTNIYIYMYKFQRTYMHNYLYPCIAF